MGKAAPDAKGLARHLQSRRGLAAFVFVDVNQTNDLFDRFRREAQRAISARERP
jgi:hypothetical protein